ncbi:MAG: hypothetical protein HY730_03730 [Candidatus Tectomicrobia bacterium]|uniref:Uncharacterized protein n=1 Tax=Tectimicrobiota bacterium TaxID=2528274 RepID=A0A933LQM5_UNCTE|nr:hypothetical protein [Candidatus Tectomicrobia bacterium]
MEQDYVFRYKLDLDKDQTKTPVYHDKLVEMIRVQLEQLLNLVILTEGDRELKPDGFKLISNLDNLYKIFP